MTRYELLAEITNELGSAIIGSIGIDLLNSPIAGLWAKSIPGSVAKIMASVDRYTDCQSPVDHKGACGSQTAGGERQ